MPRFEHSPSACATSVAVATSDQAWPKGQIFSEQSAPWYPSSQVHLERGLIIKNNQSLIKNILINFHTTYLPNLSQTPFLLQWFGHDDNTKENRPKRMIPAKFTIVLNILHDPYYFHTDTKSSQQQGEPSWRRLVQFCQLCRFARKNWQLPLSRALLRELIMFAFFHHLIWFTT